MSRQMALTRIHVEGYRSLRAIDLRPGRITVLIGANGSGKTNLLSALRMVALMRTRSLRRFVGEAGGMSALLHYGPKVTRELELRLEFEDRSGACLYGARLGYAAGDTPLFLDETVGHKSTGVVDFRVESLGSGHTESVVEDTVATPVEGIGKTVREFLAAVGFFHFHDTSVNSPLRQNSGQQDDRCLRSDGSNLAGYLRSLATSDAHSRVTAWRRILLLVRRVAPFIKELQPALVDPAHPDTSAVRLDWVDERDQLFGPHHLSDGTLRGIALFTALAQPTDSLPSFLSIDEPELGLHPAALAILAGLVRSVSAHAQVLLATQSPALLDHFEPEEIVVAEREGGATHLRRLEPAKLASWLEDYKLSELYDKNILGGRP
ncbi:MAG: AAA family ATPase [Candidatus Riflebacteria bacterium]|nr:AAA family ATPase [Candidatus Riflebacteria bacterium]